MADLAELALTDPDELAQAVHRALAEVADPEQAPAMAAYQKDQFPFFGIKAPVRRATQKAALDALASAPASQLLAFAEACWRLDERELQYVGMDALRKHQAKLEPEHLDAVAALIVDKGWWDTVDSLAAHTVGPLVARHPEMTAVMDAWIDSDELWLARTAILHQLGYKERTDGDRLFAYADRRAADTEFFIRKALGWALRQYGRAEPDAVRAYVASRDDVLSGLTKREALKRL